LNAFKPGYKKIKRAKQEFREQITKNITFKIFKRNLKDAEIGKSVLNMKPVMGRSKTMGNIKKK